jgi:Gpi18-like mannosyltransferase
MSRLENLIAGRRFWIWGAGLMLAGLVLRWWLAFSVFLNQGFAWDMATFGDWLSAIQLSDTKAYFADTGFNYPPAFADVLWVLLHLGDWLSNLPGPVSMFSAITLLKAPALIADIGIAATLLWAGRKWFDGKTALIAAALYLFVPVTWYDSAIWGQVDSLSALPMLLAVVLVIDRKPEWSAVALTVAVLMKPQGALVLLVLLPVLIGQLRRSEMPWWRLASTVGAGIAAFAVIATPWSLEAFAPAPVQGIPVIGDFAGLVGQYVGTLGMFPVLTANAFNPWILLGSQPISSSIQYGTAFWIPDAFKVFGVIPAALLGNGLFLILVGFIFYKLLKNSSALTVFTAYALLLFGFYILPTRVHERYLVQAFAVLALVWAVKLKDRILLVLLATANTINLHAILAEDLDVQTIQLTSVNSAAAGPMTWLPTWARAIFGGNPDAYGLGWVRGDASLARAEWMVWLIVAIQTGLFGYLLWQFIHPTRSNRAS